VLGSPAATWSGGVAGPELLAWSLGVPVPWEPPFDPPFEFEPPWLVVWPDGPLALVSGERLAASTLRAPK
jgi:hypothetical protein